VYSVERFRTIKGNANAYMPSSLDRVEAPDKHTVKFTLKEPYVWFLDMLANPMAVAVIAKECVEKFGDLKKWESVVGTGPWTLDTYRPNVGYNASRMAAFIAGKYDLGWENPGTINRVDWVQIKDTLKQKRPRLQTAEFPSIESARAMGGGHLRIVLRRVVPNVMATVIIVAVIVLGGVILAESSISFLGLGVPPPQPSWGAMLADFGPLLHAARALDGHLPRPGDPARGLRLQHARRRAPRRPRSPPQRHRPRSLKKARSRSTDTETGRGLAAGAGAAHPAEWALPKCAQPAGLRFTPGRVAKPDAQPPPPPPGPARAARDSTAFLVA